jgi:uncharacterized cupin superfamily protein
MMEGVAMSPNEAFVSKPGETRLAEPLNIFGDLLCFKVTGPDNAGGMAVLESHTPPKGGPPLHRHSREDEWFYILAGDYLFEIDGKQMMAGAGDSVFAPKGTAHTFQNLGSNPARMLVVAQPAGMDVFFAELAAATKEMDKRAPDMAVVLPIFERHGIEFLGPPLAARLASAAT